MPDTQTHSNYVNVESDQIGLDRANILPHNQVRLAKDDQRPPAEDMEAQLNDDENDQSKRERLREKRDHAKDKLKKVLHINHHGDDNNAPSSREAPILAAMDIDDEKSKARLTHEIPDDGKRTKKELAHDLVHNPVDTVKEKVSGQGSHQAAAKIAAKETPHGKDVELVQAKHRLDMARTETERLLAIRDLDQLIKERQNMFIRWTMDRHVTKLRRLPKDEFPKNSLADFEKYDPVEGKVIDWKGYLQHELQYFSQQYGGQYIGYGSNPPTPSKQSIMPCIERLLMASAPIQELVMTTRRVYRWDEPSETLKYMAIYFTLWWFNLMLPGALSFIIYLVAERHFHGKSIEDLRQDIIRTENVNKTAFSITELIEKRGDEHWADEAIEKVGPWAMVQIEDAADAMEVMRNFYEWRKPYRTGAALALLALGVIVTLVTPLWLLVKVSTFGMGFAIFGLWPIAVKFPEYRLLVSPLKRILWNIPTNAEWSILTLQAKGTRYTDSHPDLFDADLKPYKCYHNHTSGFLILQPHALRFESKRGHDVKGHNLKGDKFTLLYSQIDKLEKIDRIVSKNVPTPKPFEDCGKGLRVVDRKGREYILSNMDGRDEVFSQIVGYSDVQWQVVW